MFSQIHFVLVLDSFNFDYENEEEDEDDFYFGNA